MKTHEKKILASIIIKHAIAIAALVLMFVPIVTLSTEEEGGMSAKLSVSFFDMVIGNVDATVELYFANSDETIEFGTENFFKAITVNESFGTIVRVVIGFCFAFSAFIAILVLVSPKGLIPTYKKGTEEEEKYFFKYVRIPSAFRILTSATFMLSLIGFLVIYAVYSSSVEGKLNWVTLLVIFAGFFVVGEVATMLVSQYWVKEKEGFESKYGCRPLLSAFFKTKEKAEITVETTSETVSENKSEDTAGGKSEKNAESKAENKSKSFAALSENEKIELLEKYQNLLTRGIITQEEFDTKKKELL